jgi:K(+)-stimulated pyrophosphate-energized sodium pump
VAQSEPLELPEEGKYEEFTLEHNFEDADDFTILVYISGEYVNTQTILGAEDWVQICKMDFEVREPDEEHPIVWITVIAGAAGLVAAFFLARDVLGRDTGPKKMQNISDAIKEGAEAFLARQYKTIMMGSLVVSAFILFAIGFGLGNLDLGWRTAVAFLLGALCSSIAGYVGMWISIRSNIRTAAAVRTSLNDGLQIAMRGGAVSGLMVVAMSLIGVWGIYMAYGGMDDPRATPLLIVGFGFGASFVALFAQLGGGIYTKAADVGADLVGKVEAGIPEDDPRNPAVIADLVGDNVGDCAGRGADLFESTVAENIGAMILGIALYPAFGVNGIMFPLVARAFGLLASIAGVMTVRTDEDGDPMSALNRGYYVTSALAWVGFGVATYFMLGDAWTWYWACGTIGIIMSIIFVFITQYYTESKYRPVKEIADASNTGPATNVISGFAVGLETTFVPIVVIASALLGSYYLGGQGGLAVGISEFQGGLYGTAIATMGMLATCAYILAMDTFGPITDNAGGIVEMSGQPSKVRKKTDRLDAVGNTTKALTKGYAVGSAALAAFLLFSAYMTDAHLTSIDLSKPEVFVGGMIGAMLIFWFSAYAIKAVGKSAQAIIEEVRRQFKNDPGILRGTSKPDYATCVDITTKAALKEMMLPGLIAVVTPVAVGVAFKAIYGDGTEPVGALLMIGTITGVLMALVLNNSGGAWDNAKKYIEDGKYGGKGSDAHKAAVIGDTVGDPFKDTAGPSLHVVVKLLSTITLVMIPLIIATA